MLKLFLYRGLQASGKSTAAKKLLKEEPNKWKRINRDLLREMMDDSVWSPTNEKLIIKTRDFIISESLRKGLNVIVDDTNLNAVNFTDICKLVSTLNLDVTVMEKNFPIDLEEAIKRDAVRLNPVGEKVIRSTFKKSKLKYEINYKCRIETILKKTEFLTYEFDDTLPSAILCDLDGTLALIHNRNVYDASNCDEVDVLNRPVAETIWRFHNDGYQIIFISGRKDTYEAPSRRFIEKHMKSLPYTLHMRKVNDLRKDSIIKEEIFNQHIRGKINPFLVLDDRSSVVATWRGMGLTCFQVAEGNF